MNCGVSVFGGALDLADSKSDFLGRFGGLIGEAFDLIGDHGEAFARLPSACGLDGGVQRQKIGLPGDVLNQLDDGADLSGVVHQRSHQHIGLLRFLNCSICHS